MDDFDYLDDCWGKWAKLPEAKRTRQQQAVVDVCGALTGVAGDGIIAVWRELGGSMDRIIESFRMAGALEIAGLFEESGFCQQILSRSPRDGNPWITKEEELKLDQIAVRIGQLEPDAREALLVFLPRRRS